MKLIRMKGPLRPFNSIFAGQPTTVKTDHRTVCPSAGFSEAAGGCGGLAPRIHGVIRNKVYASFLRIIKVRYRDKNMFIAGFPVSARNPDAGREGCQEDVE